MRNTSKQFGVHSHSSKRMTSGLCLSLGILMISKPRVYFRRQLLLECAYIIRSLGIYIASWTNYTHQPYFPCDSVPTHIHEDECRGLCLKLGSLMTSLTPCLLYTGGFYGQRFYSIRFYALLCAVKLKPKTPISRYVAFIFPTIIKYENF